MKSQTSGYRLTGRSAGRLVGALGLLLALCLVVGGALPAYAQPPAIPHAFHGTVSVNGTLVAEGTTVEAYVGGVKKAETTVDDQGEYSLLVSGTAGATVTFHVGGALANESAIWESGAVTNLDLTIATPPVVQYDLTVDSTAGGSVTNPGEGVFAYDKGTVVDLVATPDAGYQFVNWTGDTGDIDDANAADTTITMNGNYAITANFEEIPPPPNGAEEVKSIQPSSKDNFMAQVAPDINYGNLDYLLARAYPTTTRRSLLEFGITWGTDIPAGAVITLARMSLYYYSYTESNPVGRTIKAYRLRRLDWNETQSTWNIYKTGSNWATPGADSSASDYDNTDGADSIVPAGYGWMDWDVTNQVKTAQTNNTNIAFLLRDSDESSTGHRTLWYSREYATDTTKRPKLYVEYTLGAPEKPAAPTRDCSTLTFRWHASTGATKYHLQVSTNADFTGISVFNGEVGNVTSREVNGLTAGTTYYYRIKAGNAGGWSGWSSTGEMRCRDAD